MSKEPDTLELWRKILDSITSEAWYRKGRGNSLSQTIEKIDKALVTIRKRELMAEAETMSYTGSPKIYPGWYRHGCVDVVTNHAGRGHMRSDLHRYLFVSAYAAANGKSVHLSDFPKVLLPAHQNVQKGVQNSHFSDRFRVQVGGRPAVTACSSKAIRPSRSIFAR